jgi:hypothetical protein
VTIKNNQPFLSTAEEEAAKFATKKAALGAKKIAQEILECKLVLTKV